MVLPHSYCKQIITHCARSSNLVYSCSRTCRSAASLGWTLAFWEKEVKKVIKKNRMSCFPRCLCDVFLMHNTQTHMRAHAHTNLHDVHVHGYHVWACVQDPYRFTLIRNEPTCNRMGDFSLMLWEVSEKKCLTQHLKKKNKYPPLT